MGYRFERDESVRRDRDRRRGDQLRQLFFRYPEQMGSGREAQIVVGLVVERRGEMEMEARGLGERLFAEKPKHLTRRFAQYWASWRSGE